MSAALTYVRSHISPQTRELLYGAAVLGVAGVGIPAQESGSLDQAVTSVVLTGIALVLAIINSTPRMAAVYAFLGAAGSAAQIIAVQHAGAAWAGYVGIGAVILAKMVAALRAPTAVTVQGEVLEAAKDAALPPVVRQQIKDITDDALRTVIETVLPNAAGPGQHRADRSGV